MVTWTASGTGGTAAYSFKYLLSSDAGASWTTVRDWSTTATYEWQPTLANANYRIGVWIRSATNSTDQYEDGTSRPFVVTTPTPATIASLTSDLPAPQATGNVITWTATASGGVTPYSFKYLLSENDGATWSTLRDWSTAASYQWQPQNANASYQVGVWVRSATNRTEQYEDGT